MPNNITTNLDASINSQKAQNLLDIIQSNRSNPLYQTTLQSISGLFAQMFAAFQKFFTTLGQPTVQLRFQKVGSPAVSNDYNMTNKEIYNDIQLGYTEVNSLGNAVVQNYNYSESERKMLSNKIAKLNADAIDYFMYTSGSTSQSIFAGDNFVNRSKIDPSMVSDGYTQAQISTVQGVATLSISGNTNLSTNVLTVTGISETDPKWDPASLTGCYEGMFWAVKGQMRPEGAGLHLQFSSDGSTLTELGSPEGELVINRMKMFDGNPDTFWEVEYVTALITGYQNSTTGQQISVAQFNDLMNNNASSSGATAIGGVVVAGNSGSLASGFVPVVGGTKYPFLTVEFTIQMKNKYNMNWISLNPNNFGETNYIQVTNIQLSSDGSNFVSLPGFGTGAQDTTLTNLTNQELNPNQESETLSPDQYGYAGQGIWVFDPQSVSAIKFTVNQPRAYVNPYDILMVTISQTFTVTTTSSALFGLIKSKKTSTQTVNNDVAIPYLVGQVTGFDVMSLSSGSSSSNIQSGLIAGISQLIAGNITQIEGEAVAGLTGAAIGAGIGIAIAGAISLSWTGIGLILGLVAALFGSSTKTSVSAGPQTMTKQWKVTQYDKTRFAIGIRDIEMYAYQFATQSMLTSLPFVSPKPVEAVSLNVTETIPSAFLSSSFQGDRYSWIKYFISVDNGTTWSQINPMSHGDYVLPDGSLVPQVINVNSSVAVSDRVNPLAYIDTPSPAYTVRFRAVLTRPTTLENANSYTPSLSNYSLQIYPVGGLS